MLARLVACMVCGPFVQLISREISQATSSLTFSTRDLRLDPRDSRLETRYSKLSRIESRDSRDCQLTFERYCTRIPPTDEIMPDLNHSGICKTRNSFMGENLYLNHVVQECQIRDWGAMAE